jgi:hypothetical protein
MARLYDKIVIAAFLAVACAPIAAKLAHVHDHRVLGALPPARHLKLTFASFRRGQFQPSYTSWFEQTLGLKGTSIYIDNTVLFHAVGDTKPGSTVQIGDHGVLYLYEDLAYYNAQPADIDHEAMERYAAHVATLQQRFAAQHRALIPLIIPAKTTIYRDEVSARWTRDPGAPRVGDEQVYGAMRRALDAHHVRYVDARQLFETSTAPREELWATTGRHWTQYGACLALHQVAALSTELTGRPLAISCELRRVPGTDDAGDYDLSRLLNAWWVPRPADTFETEPQPAPAGPRPSMMLIGTSFCWAMVDDAKRSQQVDVSLAYYDSTLYTGPNLAPSDLRATPNAWRDAMLGKDIYVLDLFESYIGARNANINQAPDELEKLLDDTP